jgi:molecular chaperone GrpE
MEEELSENDAVASEGASLGPEDDDNRDGSGATAPEQTAADELESLRQQAEDNWNKYLRTVAEIDNLRKRSARDLENARKFGAERLAAALLPVRDSLEAGLKAAAEAESGTLDIGAVLEGERATLRLLDQALEGVGVTEIDPEGEPFDPERHEAMSMLPSPTAEPNSVIAVIQKGYALHERIVRPARVVVARAPESPE